jgi:hypothetical protein
MPARPFITAKLATLEKTILLSDKTGKLLQDGAGQRGSDGHEETAKGTLTIAQPRATRAASFSGISISDMAIARSLRANTVEIGKRFLVTNILSVCNRNEEG